MWRYKGEGYSDEVCRTLAVMDWEKINYDLVGKYTGVPFFRGLYFNPITVFAHPPPLSKKWCFPWHFVFRLLSGPFCLISSLFWIYFTLLNVVLFFPLFSFFFYISSLFLILLFFPPNDIGWFSPGGTFSSTWPLLIIVVALRIKKVLTGAKLLWFKVPTGVWSSYGTLC